MLRKLLLLVCVGALGAWGFAACDDGGDGDGDTDSDSDGDTDGDSDADGWPCTQGSATAPQIRLTALQISAPASLSNPLLQAIINDSLDGFRFIWLVEADLEAGTMTTGSGRADAVPPTTDAQFCSVRWNTGDYAPARDNPITVTGSTISTTAPIDVVSIPIYSEESPDTPLLVLPLSQLELLNVELDADRTFVGTPMAPEGSTRYAASWDTAGSIRGWISVEDARGVEIEDLTQTLCGLLSGDHPDPTDMSQDCTSPQADWTNQPTEIPGSGGVLGYELQAGIGGGAVTID